MKLEYGVKDKPSFGKLIVFAFQQILAIMAATIAVPSIIGHGMSHAAALFGAGVGTIVYLLFTKFNSPVFLGSSFAFIGSMTTAFAGAVSMSLGYLGIIIGAVFAGLVYAVIAIIVKFAGVKWINKLMPAVVIGPTVAIIGLSLAGNAIGDLFKGSVLTSVTNFVVDSNGIVNTATSLVPVASPYVALICGLVTLFATIIASVYGKKMMKLIPFIIGICAGYAVASIFTIIGNTAGIDALKIIDFSKFANMAWVPEFTFITAFSGNYAFGDVGNFGSYIATIAVAYIPVAFVVFAEHIADHKNLSTIIDQDLLTNPGLSRTLLGDGIGSIAGAFFGGCPNTTYGESVGCVAITKNASVATIFTAAIMCILISFVAPFMTFLATIPSCVMGGVCIALYGFIAVSGLKMIQKVDLNQNKNLFVVSVVLIAGIGGMTLTFGSVTITSVACSLILGIITNIVVSAAKDENSSEEEKPTEENVTETSESEEIPA